MPLINRCGGGSSFAAVIQVTYTAGGVCTCQNGSTTLTAPDTSGSVNFKVKRAGTWVVTLTYAGLTATENVLITTDGESQHITIRAGNVYGIRRNIESTSPAWARTDDAVGFTATASVGTVAGSSDFDNCYPWNGITRQTMSTGDVMVKIPKFWYKRYVEDGFEYIKIADVALPDFELHPAFNHANTPKDCVYVGAYKGNPTKNPADSKSGTYLTNTLSNIADILKYATNKGTGWGVIDFSTVMAVQMLIMVEFATNNVKSAIGSGVVEISDNSPISTGSCDDVPNLTGAHAVTPGKRQKRDVVWRGIEGFWGNCYEPVAGLRITVSQTGSSIDDDTSVEYFVCNDPSKYSSSSDYALLGYNYYERSDSGYNYVNQMGVDLLNRYAMLPIHKVSDAGAYLARWDFFHGNQPLTLASRGGIGYGLFDWFTDGKVNSTRIMYIPN